LYEDLSDQYFEMMKEGQQFYKLNPENNSIELVSLTRIQYRHGVDKNHYIYNLGVNNSNTFFANNILGHNKKPVTLNDKFIIEVPGVDAGLVPPHQLM
jgi:hypothetical protein